MDDGAASVQSRARHLLATYPVCGAIDLTIGRWSVRLESNSAELLRRLRLYFRHFRADGPAPSCVITALEAPEPDFQLVFHDWQRDPGKVGRKDTYADIAGGRICRKFRTGMQFLLGDGVKLAVGACLDNDNQVVNFVNSQYMNWLLHQGWILCHAAAVVADGFGIAFAGFSGGGKSTLALHLMTHGFDFVSNDRLLVRRDHGGVHVSGVPKLPRINPGTALNNPNLWDVLPADRRIELRELEDDELWDLEEKYDVEIDEVFDGARFAIEADLDIFVILNWKRDTEGGAELREVVLEQRPDLLPAIMKSPGPFYEPTDGVWPKGKIEVDAAPYLANLAGVRVFEVVGRVDFEAATELCLDLIRSRQVRRA